MIAIITANLRNFDPVVPPVPQSVPFEYHCLTDDNFPPREKALGVRTQAGIPKMFGWQMFPGYDQYIWYDSSCAITNPDAVKWYQEQLGDADFAIFKHPNRKTLREEFDYMSYRMAHGDRYLLDRYEGEYLEELEKLIFSDPKFKDEHLYASTSFIYANNSKARKALVAWWYLKTLYHIHDQLSLPYVLDIGECKVNTINENYMNNPYLTFVRKK